MKIKEKNEVKRCPLEPLLGGVYLLVADESTEFRAALRRVASLARQNKAHVAILYVIEDEGLAHWGFVQNRIETDKRAVAEETLWEIGNELYEMCGERAAFYIKEGKTHQEVASLLKQDKSLRALVLGAASSRRNPLITYFTGKGLAELNVTLLIVPDDKQI